MANREPDANIVNCSSDSGGFQYPVMKDCTAILSALLKKGILGSEEEKSVVQECDRIIGSENCPLFGVDTNVISANTSEIYNFIVNSSTSYEDRIEALTADLIALLTFLTLYTNFSPLDRSGETDYWTAAISEALTDFSQNIPKIVFRAAMRAFSEYLEESVNFDWIMKNVLDFDPQSLDE